MKVAATEFLEEKKKLRKKEKKSHGSLVDHHAIWVQNLLLALRNFSASGTPISRTPTRFNPFPDPFFSFLH